MIQALLVLVAYAVFCAAAFISDPYAGWVFVSMGLVGAASAGYLVLANRKLVRNGR